VLKRSVQWSVVKNTSLTGIRSKAWLSQCAAVRFGVDREALLFKKSDGIVIMGAGPAGVNKSPAA